MTLKREQLEQIARKHCGPEYKGHWESSMVAAMEEAVALAVERCAQICDDLRAPIPMSETVGAANRALREAAAAIRAELGNADGR